MKRILQISILILLFSCKAKQTVIYEVNPLIRPQYEKRVPNKKDYQTVEEFFKDWSYKSNCITDNESNKLDSISRFGYVVFESLYSDSCFIGLKADKLNTKYILIPNQLRIGTADSIKKDLGFVYYDSLVLTILKDFKPRIHFPDKQILYYTKEYQDILPKFAEKYGVGGFILVDSYLMSNYPRYLETAPIIREIVYLRKTDEFCIEYESGSNSYQTLVKRLDDKWIKIKDLTILASD